MKKFFLFLALVLLMIMVLTAFALPALAADDNVAMVPQDEPEPVQTDLVSDVPDPGGMGFFTWAMLATYAGATAATALFTQMVKNIGILKKVPTFITSYFVALIILLLTALFLQQFTADEIVLRFINAAVVSTSANGAVAAYNRIASGSGGT